MKGFRRGIVIVRDTANVEPFLQYGTTDIVTHEVGGAVSLLANASTQNAITFLSINVTDGAVSVQLSVVSIWVALKFDFVSSGTSGVWERILPVSDIHQDAINRNLEFDVLKSATTLQIRARHIVAGGVITTDFQFHAKVSGRLLTFTMPNTLSFVAAAPALVAATATLSQLADKTTVLHNEIAQYQSRNHFGAAQIGKVHRRLNAATYTSLPTNNDTAIHIVLETPLGAGAYITKIDGSIFNSFSGFHVPLSSTCLVQLSSSTAITTSNFILGVANQYVFSYYLATTGSFVGKLVLKLVRQNVNTIANTSFIVDTLSGGLGAGNAMKVTDIVSNANVNL